MTEVFMESPLKSAEVNITIDGIVARTTIKQSFTNDTDDIIEAVYQFPLPSDAVVTSFNILINDKRFTGKVQASQQASASYEEGIASGKRSFLLELLGDGLYQVNAGNLPPGEKAILELEVASLIFMKQGLWHYYLPTVIGEKYGHSPLPLHNQPRSSIFADYNLSGTIRLANHPEAKLQANTAIKAQDDGWRFQAKLDRTFMFSWASSMPTNQLFTARSEANQKHYGIALLEAPATGQARRRTSVQLVIDCSGSMTGAAINEAKLGISEAIEHFEAEDKLNIIKFGSTTNSLFSGLQQLTDTNRKKLYRYIDNIQANMGGTELFAALEQALEQVKENGSGDILLVTDAQVWNPNNAVNTLAAKAITAGCRIFCIGVGTGVDAQLLETLSRGSAGNALMLNPRSNMDAQIGNLIDQVRSTPVRAELKDEISDWHYLPATLFENSTVPAYFTGHELRPGKVQTVPDNEPLFTLPMQAASDESADALIKLATLKQLPNLNDGQATTLATELQIVSEYTSFVFVDSETVTGSDGLPVLKQASQMTPSFMADTCDDFYASAPSSPMEAAPELIELHPSLRTGRTTAEPDHLETPALLRRASYGDTKIDITKSVHLPYEGIIEQLLEKANIDFDRKKYTAKTHVELFWLEANGLDEEVVFELSQIELDKTLLLPAILLWMDADWQILSDAVAAWCKARAKRIYAESEYSEETLNALFEEAFTEVV